MSRTNIKKKEEEQELVFGQRFDKPKKEVTMKDFESPKPAPKTKPKTKGESFIRRKGGTLARRGTATAQRAENREAARNRAKAMAKARIAKKKK